MSKMCEEFSRLPFETPINSICSVFKRKTSHSIEKYPSLENSPLNSHNINISVGALFNVNLSFILIIKPMIRDRIIIFEFLISTSPLR